MGKLQQSASYIPFVFVIFIGSKGWNDSAKWIYVYWTYIQTALRAIITFSPAK